MNRTKTLACLMVLMCFGVELNSQKHIGNYDQLFLTGTETPVENFNIFLDHPNVDRDEVIQNHFYRLVQFFEIPTELEKRAIEKTGIQLFDYLPHKTYVAAIPFEFSADDFRDLNIRSITKLNASQKKSPTILDDEKVVLQYFPNLSPTFIKSFLENKNIEIHAFYKKINAVVICNTNLNDVANFPITFFLSPAQTEVLPEYIPSKNIHRSNTLTPNIAGSPQFNGEGINVAIGDDGMIESHIDFKNRTFQSNVLGDFEGSHGEMVAGVLAGAGNLDPRMEGTAPHANLFVLDKFETVINADALYNDRGILITSTSYSDGCNRGYTSLAQLADQQVCDNNSLMHVFSAGNAGEEDCGYGAAQGWGNITGGVKMGKNVLTVATVNPTDDRPNSSSRGPANDGRIKPDISANGDGLYSTQPNNTYAHANGSSAAAPGVAGVLAQLYQAYAESHSGVYPNSALAKAAILNTADDLGNAGPDFSFGYGRINARRAYNVMKDDQFFEGTIGHMNTHTNFISVPQGVQQLRVMLYWNDREGSTVSSPSLVNDLDLRVTNALGETFLPWVLNSSPDPNLLNLPATRGIDNLNNVEQVTIDIPEDGLYSFSVEGAAVAHGSQPYFVVYELVQDDITLTFPLGGEKLVPGEIEKIHWDAFGNFGNFEIEISFNNGNTWELLGLTTGEKRSFFLVIPEIASNQIKVRVKRDGQIGMSIAPFSICSVPQNMHIAEVCPNQIRMEWDPVANAQSYLIYKLGDKFMEPFTYTNNPFIEIPITDPTEEDWYAVAAMGENNLIGRRSIAISDGIDLLNCDLGTDISIHSIATPSNSILQNCFQDQMTVSVNITNSGSSMQFDIPVFYQIDNQPPVSELYNGSIPPGVTINFTFDQKIAAPTIGNHELKVWVAQPNDQANFNNLENFELEVIQSTSAELPYFQNFDEFEKCNSDADCDAPCTLSSGWFNDSNKLSDDADWIVHQGATPSDGTGPDFDQNENNFLGKYLYLEGSKGCVEKEAFLLSPCFDLTTTSQPIFSFWYHMKGLNIGRLHVDLFDGENWFYNIMPTLNGEQNDDWQEIEIPLTAFTNKVINIRFRGVTGEDYLTDIAIDNVALFDAHSKPYPNFKTNKTFTCPDQKVAFIDNSVNSPNEWEWKFEPNAVSYVNGTTKNSPNPVVVFDQEGIYDVTLIATNNYGSAQMIKQEYVHISVGKNIPFGDTFETANLNSANWEIQNEDKSTTWSTVDAVGRDGQPTQAIFINNHSYNAPGEKDILQSTVIDLTSAQHPYLRFDWAYTQFNDNFADRLQVIISSDCAETFDEIIFDKKGEDLATATDQIVSWFPQKNHEWRTAKIDLTNYIGSSISIQFVNKNGFGNNLFLDNFLVYEYANFPQANFTFNPNENTICVGEAAITFLSNSKVENEFTWNFGEHANPNSIEGYGPHVVTFDEPGTYHISLKVKNELGYDIAETIINVIDDPVADFEYSINNNTATFTNRSIFGENYFWDFGDGVTSSLENPTHEYPSGSSFIAKLTVTNPCGEHEVSQTIISTTGILDLEKAFFINAFPNPTEDFIAFEMPALNQTAITFDIVDTRGSVVATFDLKESNGSFLHQLNVTDFAQGMYFARAQVSGHIFVKRFVKVL